MIKKLTVKNIFEDTRLDRWLKKQFPTVPISLIHKYIRQKNIKVNDSKVDINSRVKDGDQVSLYKEFLVLEPLQEPRVRIKNKHYLKMLDELKDNIIYQDQHILVINKPHGLAVQGGTKISLSVDDLLDDLKFDYPYKPKLVHRIDRDTSGILLLARTDQAAQLLTQLFKRKKILKKYWALCVGKPKKSSGVIDAPLSKQQTSLGEKVASDQEGKEAITEYRVLDNAGQQLSWIEFIPITGRTHQIRVHSMMLGTPILGDGKYGGSSAFIGGCSDKLHLHAREIIIEDFFGKQLTFQAEIPQHIKQSFDFFEFRY